MASYLEGNRKLTSNRKIPKTEFNETNRPVTPDSPEAIIE